MNALAAVSILAKGGRAWRRGCQPLAFAVLTLRHLPRLAAEKAALCCDMGALDGVRNARSRFAASASVLRNACSAVLALARAGCSQRVVAGGGVELATHVLATPGIEGPALDVATLLLVTLLQSEGEASDA